jgi:RNA 3'-terminal phosphate cyclase-like protein
VARLGINDGRLRSPGFALSLIAESTTGVILSSECVASGGDTPEDIGLKSAKRLYKQIQMGGCVDSQNQWLVLLLMAIGPEDVSKVRFGKLTPFS